MATHSYRETLTHKGLQPFLWTQFLGAFNDNLFKKFCEVAGCQELAKDERFFTNSKRVENRVAITELLAVVFGKRTTRDWVSALEASGVACGPINNIAQAFDDPQVKARGLAVALPRDAGDDIERIVI